MGVSNSTKNKITVYISTKTIGDKNYKVGTVYGSDKVNYSTIYYELNGIFGFLDEPHMVTSNNGRVTKSAGEQLIDNKSDYEVITVDNCNFSLKVDTIGSEKFTDPYYIISHPHIDSFIYVPKTEIMRSLVLNTNFTNGICDDTDLVFVAVSKYFKLVSKRSQEYKDALSTLLEKQQYTMNKTKKWEIGKVYGTYTQKSVYLGKTYNLFNIKPDYINGDTYLKLSNPLENPDNNIICDITYLEEQFNLDEIIDIDKFFGYYFNKIDGLNRENLIDRIAGSRHTTLPEGLNPFLKTDVRNHSFNKAIKSRTLCGTFINVIDDIEYIKRLGKLLNKIREFTLEFTCTNTDLVFRYDSILTLLNWERPVTLDDLTDDEKRVVGKLMHRATKINIPQYSNSIVMSPSKTKFITDDKDIEQFLQEYVYNI